MVLVFLRDPDSQNIFSLEDFIARYCNFTEEVHSILEEYIISTGGKDMLIVLDGYDELPDHVRKKY